MSLIARHSPVRLRRRPRLAAVAVACVAVLAPVLAGCSDSPGYAATVNGTGIGEQSVLDGANAFLTEASASAVPLDGQAELNQAELTALIRHRLVLMAEADRNITISPSAIASMITQAGGAAQAAQQLEVPQSQVNDVVHDLLTLEKLNSAASTKVTDVAVTYEYLTEADHSTALTVAATLSRDPNKAASMIAAQGSSLAGTGQQISLVADPSYAAAGIFAAPDGSVIVVPTEGSDGTIQYIVARVTARKVQPGTLTQDDLSSASQDLDSLLTLYSLVLAPYAAKAGISINPRFGVWDPVALQVVPGPVTG